MKTKFTLLVLLIFTYIHLNAQKRIVVDPDLTLTYYTYLSANNLLFQDKFKDNKNKIIKMGKVHEYKLKKWKIDVNKKNSQIGAFIEFIGSENNLRSIGIKVRSQVGNFFTIDLPLNRYEDLLNLEGLVAIEMGKPMEKTLDNSIQSIKADLVHQNLGYKGEGVIIGVLDNGFDLKHPAFMKSDRSGTRIKYCWDQSLNGSSPSGFNYGTEYDELEINSSSFFEPEFHGTLVAGIAAGNGFNENGITPYVGIAPEADLVLVDIKQRVGDDNLPFSDHIIDGLIYISGKAKALNKPWVANISLLAPYGPRDGTSIFEKTVNEISNDNNFGEGRIIVVAAGNKGYTPNLSPESNKTHARDNSLTSTKNIIVNSINDTYISNHEGFSLYMYTPTFSTGVGSLRWEVTIVSPNNNSYGPFNLGGGNLPFFSDTPDGFLSVSDGNPFGSE